MSLIEPTDRPGTPLLVLVVVVGTCLGFAFEQPRLIGRLLPRDATVYRITKVDRQTSEVDAGFETLLLHLDGDGAVTVFGDADVPVMQDWQPTSQVREICFVRDAR